MRSFDLYSGGDRRSIGESNRVASEVLDRPESIGVLFQGLDDDDPVLRMRCADCIEKATAQRPEFLASFTHDLQHKYSKIEQPEVKWHVAALLARLRLSEHEARHAVAVLLSYTRDRSSLVKTMAMQALTDIALRHSCLLEQVALHIAELSASGTPAMKARGKMLSKALAKASGAEPSFQRTATRPLN